MTSSAAGARAVDRVTAFTDAAVAIALTLLVLPLVDTAQQAAGVPVGSLAREHVVDLLAFVISFFVVAVFWRVHRRVFDRVGALDETLLTLNTCWLLGVVFLPVPTAVLTFEGAAERGAAMLYLGNLCYVSLLSLCLAGWLRARPGLLRPGFAADAPHHVWRSLIITGYLAVLTALAWPLGANALFLLAGMPVVRLVARRVGGR